MARARLLKPDFFKNEKLSDLPFAARLLFAGLWTMADRDGRLEDRPKRIKAELFPYDAVDVEPLLSDLSAHGFIVRYKADDKACIVIPRFVKHQHPHPKEPKSELPPPPSVTTEPCKEMAKHGEPCKETAKPSLPSYPSLSIPSFTPIPDASASGAAVAAASVDGMLAGEPTAEPDPAPKPPRPRFVPPTVAQVILQGRAIGLPQAECEAFHDHFASNGWRVGGKAPMKEWVPSLRNWKRRYDKGEFNRGKPPPTKNISESIAVGTLARQQALNEAAAAACPSPVDKKLAQSIANKQRASNPRPPAELGDLLGGVV